MNDRIYVGQHWDKRVGAPVGQQTTSQLHVAVNQQIDRQEHDAVHRHLRGEQHHVALLAPVVGHGALRQGRG